MFLLKIERIKNTWCHAVCSFFGEKIADVGKMRKDEQCCDDMNLIKYIGMNVCQTCGVVNGKL